MQYAAIGDGHGTPGTCCNLCRCQLGNHATGSNCRPGTARHRLDLGRDAGHLGKMPRRRIKAGIGRVQTIYVGQQHHAVGADHLRDARRQPVIVAIADFTGRHGVIFIHHRYCAKFQQRVESIARIQIAPSLFGVFQRQQYLRTGQVSCGQRRLIGMRQMHLSRRRRRLAFFQPQCFAAQAQNAASQRNRAR